MIFIAEIGMNHNGNFALAYELMRQAKNAGADIAKFQVGWRDGPGEINQITPEILAQLMKWSDYIGIEFMVSIISESAWEMTRGISFNQYKIASRTVIDNPHIAEKIIKKKKPTYISLGMWEQDHPPFAEASHIHYLWCKSKYPAEPWDILDMPKSFPSTRYCGYSDHTVGIDAAILAVSRGAQVIEKHFTLDKSDQTIRDHALSATPAEFATMVDISREISKKIAIGV